MSRPEILFREAAAFFNLFAHSSWNACHVRTGELEIFIAKDRSAPNPIRGQNATESGFTELRAPHLGTLVALSDVGTMLTSGQPYARLELLGETIELLAEESGTVASHLLPLGALVEFDQPLLSLR